MMKYALRILAGLVALAIIVLAVLCLAGCATVAYNETATDPDGSQRTTTYSSRTANPFGKTDNQSQSLGISIAEDGSSDVSTGLAVELQDNSGAQSVAVQILELLLPYILPPLEETDILTIPE
jgi:hypothetical protein